ncbi:MAG: hypothetical protein O2783_06790 [Chloroflexi bacterium]|nr:hypothetical protein [Chloroflexota bacterium]
MVKKPWEYVYREVRKTLKELKKLARHVDKAEGKVQQRAGAQTPKSPSLEGLVIAIDKSLERASRRLERGVKLPANLRDNIEYSSLALRRRIEGARVPRNFQSRNSTRGSGLLKKLEVQCKSFIAWADDLADGASSLYSEERSLRNAITRIKPAVGMRTTLRDLSSWLEDMPFIDSSDPARLEKLARLYVLEQVPDQEWELRYYSPKAGRAKVFLMALPGFPTQEILEYCDRQLGMSPVYVIAVKKPTWRVVWKTSS